MRRTHIMHKRDNRRAGPWEKHMRETDPPAVLTGPVLAWEKKRGSHSNNDEAWVQEMTLDGVVVARVEPVGDPNWNVSSWEVHQRFDAIILAGARAGERKAFPDDCDSARQFCESVFHP